MQPTLTKSEANSMLIGASSEGKLLLMLEAIAAGADVNARTDDSNLFSALHVACMGVSRTNACLFTLPHYRMVTILTIFNNLVY